MSDDLVYRIFVELAVLEGKRTIEGHWLTKESSEVAKLLSRAYAIVARVSSVDLPSSPK